MTILVFFSLNIQIVQKSLVISNVFHNLGLQIVQKSLIVLSVFHDLDLFVGRE